jgi:transposase
MCGSIPGTGARSPGPRPAFTREALRLVGAKRKGKQAETGGGRVEMKKTNETTRATDGNARPGVALQPARARARQGRPPRTEVDPRQMVAVRLLIAGKTRKAVAEHLGVDEKTIGRWLQEPAVKRELGQQLASVSTETWIQMVAQTAEVWEVFRKLLQSPDERIRLRASIWYLGRVLSIVSVEQLLEDDTRALSPLPKSLSALLDTVQDGEGGVA